MTPGQDNVLYLEVKVFIEWAEWTCSKVAQPEDGCVDARIIGLADHLRYQAVYFKQAENPCASCSVKLEQPRQTSGSADAS